MPVKRMIEQTGVSPTEATVHYRHPGANKVTKVVITDVHKATALIAEANKNNCLGKWHGPGPG